MKKSNFLSLAVRKHCYKVLTIENNTKEFLFLKIAWFSSRKRITTRSAGWNQSMIIKTVLLLLSSIKHARNSEMN